MRVKVRLYATLAQGRPGLRAGQLIDLGLPQKATLSDMLRQLEIEPHAVHLAIVNGRIVHDRRRMITDGDRVALFPPVGGG